MNEASREYEDNEIRVFCLMCICGIPPCMRMYLCRRMSLHARPGDWSCPSARTTLQCYPGHNSLKGSQPQDLISYGCNIGGVMR